MSELQDQVNRLLANYADLPQVTLTEETPLEQLYLSTPNRVAWGLAWITANQIVQARFPGAAIDVLPIFHPENGWDRMVITRRVSSYIFEELPADELGRIMISGEDAPVLFTPGNPGLTLGRGLREFADVTIEQVLDRIPAQPAGVGSLKRMRPSEQAPKYPDIFAAVTDLVVDYPGLVPSREVYIDDEQIDGQFHPLHLHSAELHRSGIEDRRGANLAVLTYNWFQLQYGELFAYVDRRGNRVVYRTDRQSWARPSKAVEENSRDEIKQRIKGWLRVDGASPESDKD